MKVDLEVGNAAHNLNNCDEFGVTVRDLRDHLTTLMKSYKSKTRREVKGTGLGDEELSENQQLLVELIERFEESERKKRNRYSKVTV